ncbi:uncharacterized protein YyaL (SSP411 family) [Sinomonas atrocyanea]|uniref:thioredoxin domain-containing protein n=1 Tax=Sinomonas atrocyanea TaxID=37927 RepID=UPI00278364DB|nr:thioredoxin domain-containing protein [Sinomonas atrocyanea]MDP9883282.1 uncharacterized protein YyaL (SSP411 family) [Sinomonas atrocyanea]
MTNRLAGQASAYLRQHAENPVHWQPFGDDAFAEAARRDVPVFLSIGYAACHWCHVMAHESFEDPAAAEQLNAGFVCVKVDREERPDVDSVYMAACQAMTGQGGWPLSVFTLPDGRAFYAGTYFPPAPRPGQPSFRQVLDAVSEAWRDRREAVERQAGSLADALGGLFSDQLLGIGADARHDRAALASALGDAVVALARTEDRSHGGFGTAPKFPPSPVLEFLLRHAAGTAPTAEDARGLAGRTLAAMCRSALFDVLGGGFARYSVTADWSLPHYEKMLYDNAQLLRLLAHWVRLGGSEEFPEEEAREAASLTADWMVRELGLPGGGFASSLDADSERDGRRVEGGYYVWTRRELADAVADADDAGRLASLFGLPLGEHASSAAPLHVGRALTAEEHGRLARHRDVLHAARTLRTPPSRDEKAVAGWNGLAVAALADAAWALDRPGLLGPARAAAALLKDVHWDGERLLRVSHGGSAAGIEGLLADYAGCAEGALALYAATGDEQWYVWAEDLLGVASHRFIAEGLLSDAAADGPAASHARGVRAALAGARSLDPHDAEAPSGASLLAGTMLAHAAYSGSAGHRAAAESIVAGLPRLLREGPRSAGWLLAVAQALLAGPVEVAIVGGAGEDRRRLQAEALASPAPGTVVAVGEPGAPSRVPLLADRPAAPDGGPLAYVCVDFACRLPVGTPRELRQELAAVR